MRVAVVALLVLNLFVIRICVAGSSVHCKPGAQHNGSGAASPLISATPPGGAAPPPAATPVKPPPAVTSSRVSLAVRAYESLNRNVVYGLALQNLCKDLQYVPTFYHNYFKQKLSRCSTSL
jgi:hypothetical protein